MKLRIITIGKPKLAYAKQGFDEYLSRLSRLHTIRVAHVANKYAYDEKYILGEIQGLITVVLEINGDEYSSQQLADFLKKRQLESREIAFLIGGPEGLPRAVRERADYLWSLGKLTLPHDLAMIVTLEAIYRATTINSRLPYHK